jgi:hypothetical protein
MLVTNKRDMDDLAHELRLFFYLSSSIETFTAWLIEIKKKTKKKWKNKIKKLPANSHNRTPPSQCMNVCVFVRFNWIGIFILIEFSNNLDLNKTKTAFGIGMLFVLSKKKKEAQPKKVLFLFFCLIN